MTRPSLDEIQARRSFSMDEGVVYRAAQPGRSFNEEARSCKFVMTDETPDSYGDVVVASGCNLERFNSNPIALMNHNRNSVIGTWSDVKKVAKRIEGVVNLAEEGTSECVDMTFSLMRQGIIKAASIGFMPTEWEVMRDEEGNWAGIKWLAWDMTECSVVSVPANPAALAKSIKQGNTLALDFLEDVLDTYTKTAAGLIVPREALEEAHKEATGDRTSITVGINADSEGMNQFKALVERAEAAVAALTKDDDKNDVDEVVLMTKDVEDAVEKALEEFAPGVDELPEEQGGIVRSIFERIRSVFRSEPEPEEEPEPEYVEGSVEAAKALRERIKSLAADKAA